MQSQVYRRTAELLEADINDELVALEPRKGTCFGFNAVARDVWRKLEQPRSFDELRAELLAEYEVGNEQCTRELRELLNEMRRARLVDLSPA